MSTEQKRKELEAFGCKISDGYQSVSVSFPNGDSIHGDDIGGIEKAYTRLMELQKLKALDEFMHEYETMPSNLTDDYFNAWVARYAVIMAVKCNNITADDESDNE